MRAVVFSLIAACLLAVIAFSVFKPATVTASGRVWASCAALAQSTPAVSGEDGSALGGSPTMSTTATADGGCLGRFEVSGLPVRDRYVASFGSVSRSVPRGALSLIELSAR